MDDPTGEERLRTLFVINSMAVGGPQKSLLGLLGRLDPTRHDVSVLVLQDSWSTELRPLLPDWVTVLDSPPTYRAATVPKGELLLSLRRLLPSLTTRRFLGVVKAIVQGAVTRVAGTQVRQRVWVLAQSRLPRVPGHYDVAVGILGQSTFAVVDLVDSTRKYHWVRSDSRILRRNETIDGAYYDALDGAVSVSQQCSDIYEEMYPAMRGATIVYKNDIPRSAEETTAPHSLFVRDVPRILTIARLDPLKGIDLAVEATSILRGRGVDLEWVVLGEGPERASLEGLLDQHQLTDAFRLVGMVADTHPWMAQTDLYVHPSRTEGRSNAVEEARALGRPIAACAYATVADQVDDGVTGRVCAIDAVALADLVQELLGDEAERDRLGRNALSAYTQERDDPDRLLSALNAGLRNVTPQDEAHA